MMNETIRLKNRRTTPEPSPKVRKEPPKQNPENKWLTELISNETPVFITFIDDSVERHIIKTLSTYALLTDRGLVMKHSVRTIQLVEVE